MQRLFRSRMEYIAGTRSDSCFLCAAAGGQDEDHHVLARNERALVMLNKYPYNSGHVIVAPRRHVASLESLDGDETVSVIDLVRLSVGALREALDAHGFNVGANLGEAAGAGVPDHLHFHVVPRWAGDTNFMPVVASSKVIPESLAETYARLREVFRA